MPSIPVHDAAALRDAGRAPATPFVVTLADGSELFVSSLLRVLPGKRIVAEAQWHGQRVLAKLFIADGSARHWAQEKKGIVALEQAALETPALVLAEPLPRGGHVLLSTFLSNAKSLAEHWMTVEGLPAGSPAVFEVLRPAFTLLARLHAKGLVQDDLHFGNFLQAGGQWFVIDGDAVREVSPGQPLDEKTAIANLVILLAQLPVAWDDHLAPLLEAYNAAGGGAFNFHVVLDERLAREVERVRAWRLKDYLGKAGRECTLFSVTRSVLRFSVLTRTRSAALAPLLDTLDAAIACGHLLKDGRTCTVARIEAAGDPLVVKRYNLKSVFHAVGRCWRPSRAWHSWREGHRLAFYGIATPLPLAVLEERFGPMRRRAFLLNEYCPGTSLLHLLSAESEPDQVVGAALLDLFSTLNRLRISHGDLKATNLLWHEGRIFVIDLDAMEQHSSSRSYVHAWRRDRARFLRNWPTGSVLHGWLERKLPPASL